MLKNYVKQNAPTVAENAIRQALWSNGNPLDSIRLSVKHDPVPGMYEASKAALLEATQNAEHLLKFASARRETLVSPYMKTTADYIRVMWETNLSPEEICNRVRSLI